MFVFVCVQRMSRFKKETEFRRIRMNQNSRCTAGTNLLVTISASIRGHDCSVGCSCPSLSSPVGSKDVLQRLDPNLTREFNSTLQLQWEVGRGPQFSHSSVSFRFALQCFFVFCLICLILLGHLIHPARFRMPTGGAFEG